MKEKWKYKASHFTATAGKFKIEFQPWLLNTLIKPPSDFTEPGDFSVFFFFFFLLASVCRKERRVAVKADAHTLPLRPRGAGARWPRPDLSALPGYRRGAEVAENPQQEAEAPRETQTPRVAPEG